MKHASLSLAEWRSGVVEAARRFPWVLLSGAVGTASLILSVHTHGDQAKLGLYARLAMTAALGMPLLFSLRMIRERSARLKHLPFELIGLGLLAGWFLAQPPRPFDGPGIIVIRWLLLLAALHFFAAVSPYLKTGERIGFWQFNRRLFLRFCLAALYTGVLTVGLELALVSADKLFELKLDKCYADLFFIMLGCFHPAFFLAGVPRDFGELEQNVDYPRGLKAFTQFVLAPLVAVYTAILYAYSIKILIERSWPHGWVAAPVLILSVVGIFAALLLDPLRFETDQKWAGWFGRNFPRALAPLAILLLLSVWVRIGNYGVTEERYLGIVASLWILAWALIYIVRNHTGIRWIPFSLTFIALGAAFGPWSAGAVSRSSQLRRVASALLQRGLWIDDHARASEQTLELPGKETDDLRSTLSYLISMHGAGTLQKIFQTVRPNTDWIKLSRWDGSNQLLASLKIVGKSTDDVRSFSRKRAGPVDIQGFSRMCEVEFYTGSDSNWVPQTCGDVAIGVDHGVLKMSVEPDKTSQAVPLENFLQDLSSASATDLPAEKMTVNYEQGTRLFRIVFKDVNIRTRPEGLRISSAHFYLLEK